MLWYTAIISMYFYYFYEGEQLQWLTTFLPGGGTPPKGSLLLQKKNLLGGQILSLKSWSIFRRQVTTKMTELPPRKVYPFTLTNWNIGHDICYIYTLLQLQESYNILKLLFKRIAETLPQLVLIIGRYPYQLQRIFGKISLLNKGSR